MRGGKGFSNPEEGHNKFGDSFNMDDLTILERGHKMFPPFKRGGGGVERKKFYPVTTSGHNKFRTLDFHISIPHIRLN